MERHNVTGDAFPPGGGQVLTYNTVVSGMLLWQVRRDVAACDLAGFDDRVLECYADGEGEEHSSGFTGTSSHNSSNGKTTKLAPDSTRPACEY